MSLKPVNDFQRKRIDRIIDSINIYKALESYKLDESLSLDEFNSNIRFQRQYLNNHISSEISNISDSYKEYIRDDEDFEKSIVNVQYDKLTIVEFKIFGQGYKIVKL